MNLVNNEVVQLADEIFSKLDEVLELMKSYEFKRLELAKNQGMPEQIFHEFKSSYEARYIEILDHLKLEYFLRFHHEMHFESATTCAVIKSNNSRYFDDNIRQLNLDNFGEEFLSSEICFAQTATH